ncbi:MAG: class I SAM-dependent methyltransferase [Bacteroidetes bacterium]|nr:class I SAM-dependent methyltransferase [Bacteroidota bacterium]
MKQFLLKYIFSPIKPVLEWLLYCEAAVARAWVSNVHHRLLMVQWKITPHPEHFDHYIDLFYGWIKSRNSFGWERGVFGNLTLKGKNVLELACGDGFNARNFYSLRSERVVACDFDPKAIKLAKSKNSAPNVEFVLSDIRYNMPQGTFENVIWDAAIEHFTLEETTQILNNIKARITPDGILSGYTLVERKDGVKALSHHEYEFKSKQDLQRILRPHFKNVIVFETVYTVRHNLYFWASDGPLPFTEGWDSWVH